MPDLSGRPPLGQKPPKQPAKPRKPIPKQSAKRKAYMRSDARKQGLEHMARVAQLLCLVCGAWPVEVHHMPDPRSDMRVIPLCPQHHRREYGAGAFHYSPKAFYAAHGSADELLARVARLLQVR
jgi:hypothetical protein